jgi:hypothetical protein
MKQLIVTCFGIVLLSCGTGTEKKEVVAKDTVKADTTTNAIVSNDAKEERVSCKNDSLDELAKMISGISDKNAKVLPSIFNSKTFTEFAEGFDKKWNEFDTSRLDKLEKFRTGLLKPEVGDVKTLFYPFSGPDFLYAKAFFPEADNYILMGLEPVGTLPVYDERPTAKDSMTKYFAKIKPALHTILNFSFFRTAAMKTDLRNQELDGTLHLLLLFIKRTGNEICDITPGFIDSTGNWQNAQSFPALAKKSVNNKGIELRFTTTEGKPKTLYYFSLHLEDGMLKHNKNMLNYFSKMGDVVTYLKGASYLMHEGYFSEIRNTIFKHSTKIIQDDSGIAFNYFQYSGYSWDFAFFGKYKRPIALFSYAYQPELDSLWKKQGSVDIGFGIGYNFRDKNSNLMVAKRGEAIPIPEIPVKMKPKEKKPSKANQ